MSLRQPERRFGPARAGSSAVTVRLGRWERHGGRVGVWATCPDRFHEKAEPALRREEKRRR